MSVARAVCARETRAAWGNPGTYGRLAAHLAATSFLFVAGLRLAEGYAWSAVALWTLSAGATLPLLAALATMHLLAGEKAEGTLETLLTAPVRDADVVAGKFAAGLAAVWTGLAVSLLPLALLARSAGGPQTPPGALAGSLTVLALQGVAWTALGTLCSAVARRPWGAAVGLLLVTLSLAAAWGSLLPFLPVLRQRVPLLPPVLDLIDGADGRLSLRSAVLYVSFAWWCLFTSARVLEARRWR